MTLIWDAVGAPRGTAVLLHGVTASAQTWWRIGPALAALGWQTSAVDLPGHGEAPRLDGPADLGAVAAAVALPDRVDLLVGHSLGAVTALGRLNNPPRISIARSLSPRTA